MEKDEAITRTLKTEFSFDAAHRLVGHQSDCHKLHGHRWKVEVEITGSGLDDVGILYDFINVKSLKRLFDHKTILKDCEENQILINAIKATCSDDSVYLLSVNPTAENLCDYIINQLKQSRDDLTYAVRVWESPKSFAEVTE